MHKIKIQILQIIKNQSNPTDRYKVLKSILILQ